MRVGQSIILSTLVLCTAIAAAEISKEREARIKGGAFTPQYGVGSAVEKIDISDFLIDRMPVTNAQFKEFTEKHKKWQKGSPSPLLADEHYLRHWPARGSGEKLPRALLDSPVTNISWFAALSYCKAGGKRLPTVFEWEFVAAASHDNPHASQNPEFVQRLLDWYGKPTPAELPAVGAGKPNFWGVYDLHGLVWEWTLDFNSVFVAGDNRRDAEQLGNLFCGDAAASSTDRANYAAYMRYAMRNSLRAPYTMQNVGFRCARDLPVKER